MRLQGALAVEQPGQQLDDAKGVLNQEAVCSFREEIGLDQGAVEIDDDRAKVQNLGHLALFRQAPQATPPAGRLSAHALAGWDLEAAVDQGWGHERQSNVETP
jgi:hypothetical protein